jgi:predicted enzyme related to lactoylglutathione lyase
VKFIPKIIHFEINAEDPVRAKRFYEKAFSWKINKWDGPLDYWNIEGGNENEPGINGGIQKREHPSDQVFNYINVSSVDAYKKKIEQHGGTIVSPKITVPGVGYFCMFKDPEGNKLGIMEENINAK